MQKKIAVIIGSGVAGLAIATRLAIQNIDVTVYEMNSYPGGKLSMFTKDGYQFDEGPSLFTQPNNIKYLFDAAGEPMEEYLVYRPVPIACKYFFENGKVIRAYTNATTFAKELEEQTGEPGKNVTGYLQKADKLYRKIGSIFLNYSLHKRATWLHKRVLEALKALKIAYLFNNLDKYNRQQFQSPEATQIFNRFATYNGSNPYKAPAMLSVIPHLELNEGTFYPEGGMINIANALYRLALKKGVKFEFDAPVQRIVHADNKTQGVVVNGKNIFADIVVSNVDIYFTYKNLLRHQQKAKKILKQERSSSAVIFYWGIKQQFPQLELHNIFFTNNYKEEFSHIFKAGKIYADPTVYINITSKEEAAHAPAEKENWFVMINVPANTGQPWNVLVNDARKHIVSKLNRILQTDLEGLIESETILTPEGIEQRTASYQGSLYGSSSNNLMAAFVRQPNFSSYIKNLYHCGGSVHPGGGIPLCLKSAQITAAIIKQDLEKQPKTH